MFKYVFLLTLLYIDPGALFVSLLHTAQKLAKKMNFEHLRVAQSLEKCILIDKIVSLEENTKKSAHRPCKSDHH